MPNTKWPSHILRHIWSPTDRHSLQRTLLVESLHNGTDSQPFHVYSADFRCPGHVLMGDNGFLRIGQTTNGMLALRIIQWQQTALEIVEIRSQFFPYCIFHYTSYELKDFPNHRQLDYLVNFTFKLTTNKTSKFTLLPLCKENPGGRLNKKDGLTRYGDSHVKDKTS